MAHRLGSATGPTHFFLLLGGVDEWDREGREAYDPEGLAALIDEVRTVMPSVIPVAEVDAHISDIELSDAVIKLFDD